MKKHVIKIYINGGLIADIQNIPKDILIQVFDADTEGADTDKIIEENGIDYYYSTW